ncbi:MAG: hypothetical protein QNK19_14875 [Xanthomonadales bacterium]|nr:hypothetical protein [Xanthomonadales bacterium]
MKKPGIFAFLAIFAASGCAGDWIAAGRWDAIEERVQQCLASVQVLN